MTTWKSERPRTGPETALHVARPRRWPGTMAILILTPAAMAGCSWLAQKQGTLVLLLGAFVAMVVLVIAWTMCGAGPGALVAVSGFAFMLFVGPALDDYVLDQRGLRQDAVIVKIGAYHTRHTRSDGRTCTVVPLDTAEAGSRFYDVDGTDGCGDELKTGQRVMLVTDPQDWLAPRLGTDVTGVSPSQVWISGGLLVLLEAFILYGRLRRRA
ncbi:tweety family protein [Streptomyces sp. CoT10]|uniref:tweety family protein n=1 Tax=Streptomyces sp. CoT10 TaxID=2875762 RepID=UPI001CD51F4E|nr:tweety family protein [Streptomyces sp. CoT10]